MDRALPKGKRTPFYGNRFLWLGAALLLVSLYTVLSIAYNARELERKRNQECENIARSLASTTESLLSERKYQDFAQLLDLFTQIDFIKYIAVYINDIRSYQTGNPEAASSAWLQQVQTLATGRYYSPRDKMLYLRENLDYHVGEKSVLTMVFSQEDFQRSKRNILIFSLLIFLLLLIVMFLLTWLLHLERNKEELIKRIRHDAKQDLTIIQGRLSFLLRKFKRGETPEKLVQDLKAVLESAESMDRFLDNLSDQQLLSQRRVEFVPRRTALAPLIHSVVNGIEQKLSQRDLTVSLDLPAEDVTVIGDTHIIKRVLMNLLHNAVKYATLHGRIRIRLRALERSAVCYIQNDGEAIPAHSWKTVFRPYTRLSRLPEGVGLGLAISKELTHMMGGELGIAESEPGKGTTFFISLPRAPKLHVEG